MSTATHTVSPHIFARLQEAGVRRSTLRNSGVGFLIGSVVLVLKYNKSRRSDANWQKFKNEWMRYLFRYPIFLSTFTILFKGLCKIGRELAGYRGLMQDGSRKSWRSLTLALTAFVCGYIAERTSPIFSWNWSLYALLRSLLGLCRLIIPIDWQPYAADVYFLIHGALPIFICYNCKYIPSSYASFFKATLDEPRERYIDMYGHNHGTLPPCKLLHIKDENSCLRTTYLDFIHRFKICFSWYMKFYVLTAMLGGVKFLKRLKKKPLLILYNISRQAFLSCLFLLVSFAFPSRIHCLYKWILEKYHYYYKNNNYQVIAPNLIFLMLGLAAWFGTICLRLEKSESKRTDIALFSVWRILECYIRTILKIETYDHEEYHPILGNSNIPRFLVAFSFAIAVYVYSSKPSALKALERSIIPFFLS